MTHTVTITAMVGLSQKQWETAARLYVERKQFMKKYMRERRKKREVQPVSR